MPFAEFKYILVKDQFDRWFVVPEAEKEDFDCLLNKSREKWSAEDVRWASRREVKDYSSFSFSNPTPK